MTEPAYSLSQAAKNVRQFNHASRATGTGWEYPSASYTALGALSHLVSMLPQALEQAINPVMRTYEHGRVAIDGGGDADEAVKHMRAALANAKQAAELLNEAVAHLHSTTSAMGLDTRGLPGFED
ncbi:hypothetical protein [Streptomyces halobius]|uniref:Excreted virulence factor EspC (Type VII ESX diderm) n=1 Tax=Streptomyces halobius TaxID=2879846 RepID=A0ABY4M0D6_9ACTN|nr:hypothetical protein [Streptomyces halobius]UQA91220.1 hypothetical protein K9S39_04420 [Streptomyces halobius]